MCSRKGKNEEGRGQVCLPACLPACKWCKLARSDARGLSTRFGTDCVGEELLNQYDFIPTELLFDFYWKNATELMRIEDQCASRAMIFHGTSIPTLLPFPRNDINNERLDPSDEVPSCRARLTGFDELTRQTMHDERMGISRALIRTPSLLQFSFARIEKSTPNCLRTARKDPVKWRNKKRGSQIITRSFSLRRWTTGRHFGVPMCEKVQPSGRETLVSECRARPLGCNPHPAAFS